VNGQELTDALGESFGRISGSDKTLERTKPHPTPSTHVYERDMEQVHVCFGTKGLAYDHPLRFASYVLNAMLGDGMSSRLFQEVREKRGLAYAISSYLDSYSDAGATVVYAGTSKEALEEMIEILLREFNRFKKEPLEEESVKIAKEHLKGSLLLSLESSESIMTHLATSEIYFDSYLPVEELMSRIDGVTGNDIQYLANELFDPSSFCLAALGPTNGENLEGLLRSQPAVA